MNAEFDADFFYPLKKKQKWLPQQGKKPLHTLLKDEKPV